MADSTRWPVLAAMVVAFSPFQMNSLQAQQTAPAQTPDIQGAGAGSAVQSRKAPEATPSPVSTGEGIPAPTPAK